MFRPVKTKKVYEEIVQQIKLSIEEGKLKPGDKMLSERELSEQFDVSRASVREALSALEMMGIISIYPGEGSYVRHLPSESMLKTLVSSVQTESIDVLYLLELRKIIEVEIAALAALRATEEDINDLQQALSEMHKEVAAGVLADDIDAKFHYSLVRAAHNPLLLQIAQTVSQLLSNNYRSIRLALFLVPGMSKMFYEAHVEILEAVCAKNCELARKKMHMHLNAIEEAIRWYKYGGEEALKIFPKIYNARNSNIY
ncbi:FadR/GntR family transcriptional regulator [Dendrosporobacter sp. 1207_IL3150]|uniref:FadR/GntR family transcriptional regulator n=1 Tax=Dendrosporobacter sp. 1207_IL3150 TaxID=3084054 RepID=UPI002FD98C83